MLTDSICRSYPYTNLNSSREPGLATFTMIPFVSSRITLPLKTAPIEVEIKRPKPALFSKVSFIEIGYTNRSLANYRSIINARRERMHSCPMLPTFSSKTLWWVFKPLIGVTKKDERLSLNGITGKIIWRLELP